MASPIHARPSAAPRRPLVQPAARWVRRLWNDPGIARPATALPRLWPTAWVTILPIAMMLATEYKFRQRTLADSLSGSADPAVLVELGVYAAVVGYLVLFVVSPPRLRRPTAVQFFMRGYAAAMFVSVIYSEYPQLGAVRGAQLLVMVVTAGAIATRASARQMLQLGHAFVALVTGSVLIGLVYRVPFSPLQANRFSWIYVHPVTAGAMLALAIVIALCMMTNHNELPYGLDHWPRPVYLVVMAVMTAALLGTQTRGAIGAAVVGLMVSGFFIVPRRERLPLGVVAGTGLALTVAAFIGPIVAFLERGESTANLATVSNRTELWSIAFGLFTERPITGWGLATSRGIFYDKVGLGGAHNAFVNVLVDGGLIGTSLWLALVVAIALGIRRLLREGHRDGPLLAGLLATMMVNGLTVEGVGSGIGMSALWLLLTGAWVGVAQRQVTAAHRQLAPPPSVGRDRGQLAPRPARREELEISRV